MVPAPEEMAQHARRGPRPLTRAASREWPQPPGSGLPWGMSGLLKAQRGLGGPEVLWPPPPTDVLPSRRPSRRAVERECGSLGH